MYKPQWKEKAFDMFFNGHIKIVDISRVVERSRQTVTQYLKGCEGFWAECENRKQKNAEARKNAKREQAKGYRAGNKRKALQVMAFNLDDMGHTQASKILSYERIYDNYSPDGGYLTPGSMHGN